MVVSVICFSAVKLCESTQLSLHPLTSSLRAGSLECAIRTSNLAAEPPFANWQEQWGTFPRPILLAGSQIAAQPPRYFRE